MVVVAAAAAVLAALGAGVLWLFRCVCVCVCARACARRRPTFYVPGVVLGALRAGGRRACARGLFACASVPSRGA